MNNTTSSRITVDDLQKRLKDMQAEARQNGIDVNVFRLQQALYEQHKQQHGSYSHLIHAATDDYERLMSARYAWILDRIDETIESKFKYDKGY
ncbi:MAG: hypothetical protein ABIG69_11840 [Bacteroidota bacterium]